MDLNAITGSITEISLTPGPRDAQATRSADAEALELRNARRPGTAVAD